MPNLEVSESEIQRKVVKTLAFSQVLNGVGIAGTIAAGSLLVASITDSETLAGLAGTSALVNVQCSRVIAPL